MSTCKHCGGCDICDRCNHCGKCKNCGKEVIVQPFGPSYPIPYQPPYMPYIGDPPYNPWGQTICGQQGTQYQGGQSYNQTQQNS